MLAGARGATKTLVKVGVEVQCIDVWYVYVTSRAKIAGATATTQVLTNRQSGRARHEAF